MRRTGLSIWSDLKDCTAGCQDTSQRGGSIRFIVACLLRAIIISIVNDQDNQVSLPSRKGPNLRMVICKQYKSKANFRFKGRSSHMYQNGCAWTLNRRIMVAHILTTAPTLFHLAIDPRQTQRSLLDNLPSKP